LKGVLFARSSRLIPDKANLGFRFPQSRRFFVAVHVGAGYHAAANEKALRSVMRRACLAASTILRQDSGECIDAVSAAIQVLEVFVGSLSLIKEDML
jgi:hypothetical protein